LVIGSALQRTHLARNSGQFASKVRRLRAGADSLEGMTHFLARTVVVIPALNEAACVEATVRGWQELGAGHVRVIDNGSDDETASVARGAGAEVLVERRRGYGAAAWAGLQNWPESFEWVLFSSADGSDRLTRADVEQWNEAVTHGAQMIVGDRTSGASRRYLKGVQRFGNWIVCQAIASGWGERFNDMGSLRLVRHRSLMAMHLTDRGFGWNVEMQVRAIERGLRIVELPVAYFPRLAGQSKISGNVLGTIRAGAGILRILVRLREFHRHKKVSVVPERAATSGLR
jgi:glycosyltransferase involved in cell wall biosynthesis